MKRVTWIAILLVVALALPGSLSAGKGGSGSSSSRGYSGSSRSSSPSPSRGYSGSSSKPSSSSRGYSGSSSKPTSSKPSSPPAAKPSEARGYSGSSSTDSKAATSKTTAPSWNDEVTKSGKQQASQKKYESRSSKPQPRAYPGQSASDFAKTTNKRAQSERIRGVATPQRYTTYDNRSTVFYGGYAPQPFHDMFSPFLMGYLLSSAMNSQSRGDWAYNHRDEMDPARYQALLEKDADLAARVKQLEAQKAVRDPNYVPPGMQDNPDLMYSKDAVAMAVTEDPVVTGVPPVAGSADQASEQMSTTALLGIVGGLVALGIVVLIVMICLVNWP